MQSKILLSILCSSLLANFAFADVSATSDDTSVQNSGLDLADGGGHLTKTYELGAVEITAPEAVDANPSVTTIKVKDMKDSNANHVADAVQMVPGVMIGQFDSEKAGRGEPVIQIRGFGVTQIGLYLDGIPIMSIYDRQTDYSQFITQGVSSIQVSKGFTSPVYGMNALGGGTKHHLS